MKKLILRFLCCFCAAFVLLNSVMFFDSTSAGGSKGKMSSVYAYILNDYIETYGVLSTDEYGRAVSGNGFENPCGVIYGDLINFDDANYPYLVLFVADGEYNAAACHIWHYSPETEKARRTAVIAKKYSDIPEYQNGEFNIANNTEKNFIVYNTYDNGNLINSEFYTVSDGTAVMYINNPNDANMSGVAYFNNTAFNSAVDISNYNISLDRFFSKLKDAAAGSVTGDSITERLNDEDRTAINRVLLRASLFSDFDINNYSSDDDYKAALEQTDADGAFSRLNKLYDLGDGIYYAIFDTERTRYNYAVLRKSDTAEHGYQLLKARTDCIPLADKELEETKLACVNCPLIYDMSLEKLKLEKKTTANITVKVGTSPAVKIGGKMLSKKIPKVSGMDAMRLPAACISGGITIALLSALWVYLYAES